MDLTEGIPLQHDVIIKVDNNSLLKIALVQVGILLLGFILNAIFKK